MDSCCIIPVLISETDFEVPVTLFDSEPVDVEIDVTGYYPDKYEGNYNVIPKTSVQVLRTKDMMMTDDMMIEKIPNCYGLITWNGSFLRVS